ncbi:MAG: polyphosphate kinase 1 [Dehalococcoidia bacterium]|nr:polyphosphate kinase 1 [Dehalococcoidia bacterium]
MDETEAPPAPAPNVDEVVPSPAKPVYDLDDPALYLNRELSWLEFNQRVLEEALDPRNRLLERVKFLAITASNLDEFYTKRMGWLKQAYAKDPRFTTVDGLTIAEQMEQVIARCKRMHAAIDAAWHESLGPELADHGIKIVRFGDLEADARGTLTAYFEQAIFPVLTPLVVDPAHPFPFISSGSLSLALNVRHPGTGQDRFARIKVPGNRPRFVDAGDNRFVLLEDLIISHVGMLFPGMDVTESYEIRVIRSAEMGSPGEEADDLLEVIESALRRRRLAQAVSLEVSGDLTDSRRELLLEELQLREADVYSTAGPLGLADLFQLASLPISHLCDVPFTPATPSWFQGSNDSPSFFSTLRERDILVHHPYESFDKTVVQFVEQAAEDPQVLAIKQTMYRTSPDSPILEALIEAAGRGKQVAVLVELTARFDEANNIEWARKLESAGVHVAYGLPDLKIHSKISLVVREEAAGVTMYAHVGTGNYNSRTARTYTDLGLFTSDARICGDLLRVFNFLTGYGELAETEVLLAAPVNLRRELVRRVQREIALARSGRPARVALKMNALEDFELTRLLYEAAQAGVQVDLIVRGICRLRPGLPGLSENVRVVSVIGRFLEHSRVYYFANDGEPEYFIGSADVMKRNLDERIEVLAPVRGAEHRRQLDELLALMLEDRRQGWRLLDREWSRDCSVTAEGAHSLLLARAPFS